MPTEVVDHPRATFAHEVLLYAGTDEFVAGCGAFIREGVAAGEPVLVVVDSEKVDLLREELNGVGEHVTFADMAEVGQNPARIIPAWQDFVDRHLRVDRPVRGIGEPIWAGRSPVELVECQRHESLLNVAFAHSPAWQLLCPYDTSALPDAVIDEALRSHPIVLSGPERTESEGFRGLEASGRPFDAPLADPPPTAVELPFDRNSLVDGRYLVYCRAADAGLSEARTNDLVLAVNEILTNSVRYGGGGGVLRIWQDDRTLVCEVEDRGLIDDPLVDRRQPDPEQPRGRGLWMANHLCDLVQIRAAGMGTVIRLHIRRG
jgi:anti-sigma regulatory factor (Ser/Thr protein kinase)